MKRKSCFDRWEAKMVNPQKDSLPETRLSSFRRKERANRKTQSKNGGTA